MNIWLNSNFATAGRKTCWLAKHFLALPPPVLSQLLLQDKPSRFWYTDDNTREGENAVTVYDVLNRIDKDLAVCDDTIRRSRRKKTLYTMVKAAERKKTLNEIKTYILANH